MLPIYLDISCLICKTRELTSWVITFVTVLVSILNFFGESMKRLSWFRWKDHSKTSQQCIGSQNWNYTFFRHCFCSWDLLYLMPLCAPASQPCPDPKRIMSGRRWMSPMAGHMEQWLRRCGILCNFRICFLSRCLRSDGWLSCQMTNKSTLSR